MKTKENTTLQLILEILLIIIALTKVQNLQATKLFEFENNACNNLYDYPIWFLSKQCFKSQNAISIMPDLVLQNGYNNVQTHTAVTKDGYILTIFRIPPQPNDNRRNQQPIYIQHGISADSATWAVTNNRSLAFVLADQGYDVWLGNMRGSSYSRKHISLKDTNPQFWDYNLDMMKEDITAFIDKISNETSNKSIIYIGHSQGTTMGFMYASEYPKEAQAKLKGIVALAPIVYVDFSWYFKPVVALGPLLGKIANLFQIHVVALNDRALQRVIQQFCKPFPYVCKWIIEFLFGRTYQLLARDLLVFFNTFPVATGIQQLLHFGQILGSGQFQKFDFGKNKNLEKYGQKEPPLYNLGKIKVPVFMFYGKADTLVSEKNVERLYKELGSEMKDFKTVPINNNRTEDQFDHIDFIFSYKIETAFYKDLRSYLDKF